VFPRRGGMETEQVRGIMRKRWGQERGRLRGLKSNRLILPWAKDHLVKARAREEKSKGKGKKKKNPHKETV